MGQPVTFYAAPAESRVNTSFRHEWQFTDGSQPKASVVAPGWKSQDRRHAPFEFAPAVEPTIAPGWKHPSRGAIFGAIGIAPGWKNEYIHGPSRHSWS